MLYEVITDPQLGLEATFARVGQQLEDADQHPVVAQQVLVGDALAQRHDLVAIVAGDVVGRAVGLVVRTDLSYNFV